MNAVFHSSYVSEIFYPLVPTMTSNTTPSGEAFTNSVLQSGYEAYKAFIGFDNPIDYSYGRTGYWEAVQFATNVFVGYKFTTPTCVNKAVISNYMTGDTCTYEDINYKIQYSDDNAVWEDAYTGLTNSKEKCNIVPINVNENHMYWRLMYLTRDSESGWSPTRLQFYGRYQK